MDLGLSGLASGFDWRTLVDQLSEIERTPQRRLLAEQDRVYDRRNAYSSIETQLKTLQNKVEAISDPSLFESRSGNSSDGDIAGISAVAGAPTGSYDIDILSMATSSVWTGASGIAAKLSITDDVSTLQLSDASFYRPLRDGVFSVNGERIDVSNSDTLQDVFDRIYTATGGDVTASYNSTTDRIELASSNEIVLGSANDTSNFLQLTRLNNNGSGLVSSSAAVGSIVLNKNVSESNLATALTDGGGGNGQFIINGETIEFDTSTDAIGDILKRINNSQAGVSASYDSITGQFNLTNKKTGDLGITMEDVSGNFLAATGILGSTFQRGENLRYTINGGSELQSFTNTIDEDSSGLAGITINAKAEGKVSLNVSIDESKITSAINSFISDFNSAQTLIQNNIKVETSADGEVDAAILAGELEATQIASSLRNLANSKISGISSGLDFLNKIGINSNGDDNTISLTDPELLSAAIQNNAEGLKDMFTNESSGLAKRFKDYLERTVGDEGSVIAKQENLTTRASALGDQVEDLERIVKANRESMIARFIAMETAQAKANQQLQFLTSNLG